MAAVLVYIDLDGPDRSIPDASSLQALAAGRLVASSWGATLYAALIIHETSSDGPAADSTGTVVNARAVPGLESVQHTLSRAGADKIVVAITDAAPAPLWAALGSAWSGVLDHLRPRLVLFGADAPATPELGPRTGARIGARLLARARATEGASGADRMLELRDRDGAYVRAGDSGAAVALIGTASSAPASEATADLVVLGLPGTDTRVELVGDARAELRQTAGILVALGDDALEPAVIADARRLATLLGAQLIGGPAAARAGAVAHGAVFDRSTPLAPELCITIGALALDLSGATSVIRIGSTATKGVDGALPGSIADGVAALVRAVELA